MAYAFGFILASIFVGILVGILVLTFSFMKKLKVKS
nr:MAG TPA: hypothetical protein [Bacteriophage sp.]